MPSVAWALPAPRSAAAGAALTAASGFACSAGSTSAWRRDSADFYPQVTAAATTAPGVVNAVTLTDESNAQLRATYTRVPAMVGNRIYVRSFFQKNSADACGFVVEERDAANAFLNSTFYGTGAAPADWTAYMIGHKVTNANTATLRIGYVPAAASNAPALMGATDVAKLQISRTAIGR